MRAGDRARADMEMRVGDVAQALEVQAQSPALQSDSATLTTVLASQSVQYLPLNGRNFVTLIQSTVGIAAGLSHSILSGTRPDEGTGAPGATPILGAAGLGPITQSNLALNPRQYQFALKLIF